VASNTKIEWADHTVNFWMGCKPVSEGCEHCYARRFWGLHDMKPGERRQVSRITTEKTLRKAKPGDRVFVNSLSDFFDPEAPQAWRDEAVALMALHPRLTFLLLTKRPQHMAGYIAGLRKRARGYWHGVMGLLAEFYDGNDEDARWQEVWQVDEEAFGPRDPGKLGDYSLDDPRNIWLGVTAENQRRYDERVRALRDVRWPGKKFLSLEPLLGEIRFGLSGEAVYGIDLVIAGGESGPAARPMAPKWVRSVREQCQLAGVPFFFKQWGEYVQADALSVAPDNAQPRPFPDLGSRRCLYDFSSLAAGVNGRARMIFVGRAPDDRCYARLGKTKAGRVLDGRTWEELPGEERA
jgi:protein gp37